MERVLLSGLVRIAFADRTATICDGGFLDYNGERYRSADPVLGSIDGFEALTEGVGDEAPAGTLTFLPQKEATPAQLNDGAHQGAPLQMWIAEIDPQAGTIIGEPDLMTDSMIDRTVLKLAPNRRALDMDFVPRAERLFLLDEGNTLSDAYHKSVWPGESGCANATGVSKTVAWGVHSSRGT